jgi:hypothetical protein
MGKVLFFRAKLFCPESQEEASRVVEIWPSIEDTIAIFQVMKDDSEKSFGTQL